MYSLFSGFLAKMWWVLLLSFAISREISECRSNKTLEFHIQFRDSVFTRLIHSKTFFFFLALENHYSDFNDMFGIWIEIGWSFLPKKKNLSCRWSSRKKKRFRVQIRRVTRVWENVWDIQELFFDRHYCISRPIVKLKRGTHAYLSFPTIYFFAKELKNRPSIFLWAALLYIPIHIYI